MNPLNNGGAMLYMSGLDHPGLPLRVVLFFFWLADWASPHPFSYNQATIYRGAYGPFENIEPLFSEIKR